MGDRYAWLKVEGDWGIRLGNWNIKLEVWDYGEDGTRSSKVGEIEIGRGTVKLRGKQGKNEKSVSWEDLNR